MVGVTQPGWHTQSAAAGSAHVAQPALWALVLAGLAACAWLVVRARRRHTPSPMEPDAVAPPSPQELLRNRALARLVAIDDALLTSRREVARAADSAGSDHRRAFEGALAEAEAALSTAVALMQGADRLEGTPDEVALLDQVVAQCADADGRLDALAERVDEQRDLPDRVSSLLDGLDEEIAAFDPRLAQAHAIATDLTVRYSAASAAIVDADLAAADARVRAAASSVAAGRRLLAAGDSDGAVARMLVAEQSLAQAGELVACVASMPAHLASAVDAVAALLAQTAHDLDAAEQVPDDEALASARSYTAPTLAWVREAISAGPYDPFALRRALQETDAALAALLDDGGGRPAGSEARAAALWAGQAGAADASIETATTFLATRLGAVGADTRLRLAEARRQHQVAQSLAASDPPAALVALQEADRLADEALALGQRDEAQFRDAQRRAGWRERSGGAGRGPGGHPEAPFELLLAGILLRDSTGRLAAASCGGTGTRARRAGQGAFDLR